MHIEIPHKFSKAQATKNVKQALEENRSKLEGHATIEEERWEGDTLHLAAVFQGQKISGTLEVADKNFILDATLPLLWRMFEGKIEKAIKDQVTHLLS
ncbi:polyhydroxyalkanoic acid system family protein [Acetobacteraceae bacterium]|nr:polyhydroxyalkanoic acid system family protein [Candidatus Parcubacteria bacterium]